MPVLTDKLSSFFVGKKKKKSVSAISHHQCNLQFGYYINQVRFKKNSAKRIHETPPPQKNTITYMINQPESVHKSGRNPVK